MSPDGHCRAFDASAQGTVGGNGIGIVVLKRLSEALADGDHIHAVIKGAAINNDGSGKVGYTAPSIKGQAQVIAMAQAVAGIEPQTITYIEAHGTGTDLGDPIEVAALTQAFRAGTNRNGFCALGSVKTNIGHLDTAAGVAGLIKTVMALKHKVIPPSLHFDKPNPKINFANSPFYVNDRLSEWKTNGTPRRAGINSFGIGGTNSHVIVEEAPLVESSEDSRPEQLLLLSARTISALEAATINLAEHFKQQPALNLADAAYTLQVGRKAFDQRRVVVCRDRDDAISALSSLDSKRVWTSAIEPSERSVVFMFSGQGAQYVNMARGLYESEPTFREHVDLCAELLIPHLGRDLREVLYPRAEKSAEMAEQLQQTALAQPALFVIEYALSQLWMEWGVRPEAMIGHSLGEYVAACVAGVFSLEEALSLVAARGRLMQQMPEGDMLALPLAERDVRLFLNGKLSLAAVNGPALCVVSGPIDAVRQLETELAGKGLGGQRLRTSHAFHSEMMQPILNSFVDLVRSVNLRPPQIPYISNLTGRWITAEEATDPQYWANHLRCTVRFSEGLEQLLAEPNRILLEVGPGQILSSLARRHPAKAAGQLVLSSMRHQDDSQSDERAMLGALGQLWLSGTTVNWRGFNKHQTRLRTPLPTYPFERSRYWVEHNEDAASAQPQHEASLDRKQDVADWFYIPVWKRSAPPMLLQPPDAPAAKSRWLVFSDACGLGEQVVSRLDQEGHYAISVRAGEQFERYDEKTYAINPRERLDYERLAKELRAQDKFPQIVAHLWSVTADNKREGKREDEGGDEREATLESFAESQSLGFYSLLFLAQTFGELSATESLRLGVVSNGVQSVTGEESLWPSKATVLGPCAVIPEEYSRVSCRSIDVCSPPAGFDSDVRLADQLIAELTLEAYDKVVAYRGRHRWVQTFEAVRLNKPALDTAPRLREGGVYLITGGMGGIGLTIAEHLARSVRAKLVLVGRSPLPKREEWEHVLASADERDEAARKIRKVLELENSGAEVMVASADVADHDAMRDVVKRVVERFGTINGVVHSAGIAGGRMIQLQTEDVASRVLAPKTLGTLVLDRVLKDFELDFLVLCSSLSALHGALGQTDYCSANAFLDAFAHYANQRDASQRVVSVNWDTWQEVGMAVNTVVPREMEAMRAESLKQGIKPEEGADALMRILRTGLPQVAVSTTDLQALLEVSEPATEAVRETESGPEKHAQALHERPRLRSQYVAPHNQTEQSIASIWQELLGVEQVGVDDNFFELGGHSLLAVQLTSRLRAAFNIELTMRNLFDSPTIAELAQIIEQSRQATDEDTNQIDEMLKLVEQLSEHEIHELLGEQRESREGADY